MLSMHVDVRADVTMIWSWNYVIDRHMYTHIVKGSA